MLCRQSVAPTLFYFLQDRKQLHWLDANHGPLTQPGKQVTLQLSQGAFGVTSAPALGLFGVSFQRHRLEGILKIQLTFDFFQLSRLYGGHCHQYAAA